MVQRSASASASGFVIRCAVRDNATVACWGDNTDGQIGDGDDHARSDAHCSPSSRLPSLSLLTGAVAVATGDRHTCVQISNDVRCSGDNSFGQLGDGTTATRLTPVSVIGVGGSAVALVTSDFHNCVLLTDGTARCWGLNNVGQLGDGTTGRMSPHRCRSMG